VKDRTLAAAVAAVVGLGALTSGCGGSSGGGAAATAAAVTSAGQGAVSSATAPTPTGPGWPLTPALRQEVARAFAPQLRFNAYHNDGNGSPQNRHEDYFPMAVSSFLTELASGQARVVVAGSTPTSPGVSEVRSFAQTPVFDAAYLGPYPRRMVGDPPGTAPLYVHLYEDPAGRSLAPDGSGELVVHAEYYVFYGHDRSEARIFGFVPTTGNADVTGHRADWERTAYRLRVRLGPAGAFVGGDIEEGYFYGHQNVFLVPGADLERLDDAGQPDPQGLHPVVYVAQGKHASYPQAGEWKDGTFPSWLADYTDFFRGNGVWVDGWSVPLVDLEHPAGWARELDPPALQTLLQTSPGASSLPDWTFYAGRWGPDLTVINHPAVTIRVGLSPSGPKQKSSYGADVRERGTYPRWSDVKAATPRLRVYDDLGITIPRASPVPVPIRR